MRHLARKPGGRKQKSKPGAADPHLISQIKTPGLEKSKKESAAFKCNWRKNQKTQFKNPPETETWPTKKQNNIDESEEVT